MQRRQFISTAMYTTVMAPLWKAYGSKSFFTSDLPYSLSALEPIISKKTLEYHYGKHHLGYLDTIKKLHPENIPLNQIQKLSTVGSPLWNATAQAINHDFYWKSLKPVSLKTKPSPNFEKWIQSNLGSIDNLKNALRDASLNHFGSGWTWLTISEGKPKIYASSNGDNPWMNGETPLFTLDLWEHAYYLDYQNKRKDYVVGTLDKLINWDFISATYEKSKPTL